MRIILASQSPRRRELLAGMGLDFIVVSPDIDEEPLLAEGLSPDETAKKIALAKARDVAKQLSSSPNRQSKIENRKSLVIASDTLIDLGGTIIGKPRDEDDARRILRLISSNEHYVVSSIAIIELPSGNETVACDRTLIRMRPMTEDEIEDYVASGEAMGKAGAYAIQEPADKFVGGRKGNVSTVIGLPVELLKEMLSGLRPF